MAEAVGKTGLVGREIGSSFENMSEESKSSATW